jgi:hypothetical protein
MVVVVVVVVVVDVDVDAPPVVEVGWVGSRTSPTCPRRRLDAKGMQNPSPKYRPEHTKRLRKALCTRHERLSPRPGATIIVVVVMGDGSVLWEMMLLCDVCDVEMFIQIENVGWMTEIRRPSVRVSI